GVRAGVLHLHTVKPLDQLTLLAQIARVPAVLTVEEHNVIGGLGSAVAEVMAEANLLAPKRFKRLGLPDVFPDKYGSQASLFARYGLTPEQIAAEVRNLLAR
ncbi:MAG: transketolase, partial [Verrucomicrobia bacterium]|nr:transketolase [Verrucomicrobiota bacterium]